MNGHFFGLLFQVLWGAVLFVVGVWLLCAKLPAEWARRKRMEMAVGVIQDGLPPSNVFKKLSDAAQGTQVPSMPMVAFKTNEGIEVITNVGVVRRGRGSKHTVFEIGQEVLLNYDPVDPKVVSLDGQPSRIFFYGMFCAGMLFCGGFWEFASLRDLLASQ